MSATSMIKQRTKFTPPSADMSVIPLNIFYQLQVKGHPFKHPKPSITLKISWPPHKYKIVAL